MAYSASAPIWRFGHSNGHRGIDDYDPRLGNWVGFTSAISAGLLTARRLMISRSPSMKSPPVAAASKFHSLLWRGVDSRNARLRSPATAGRNVERA